MIYKLKCLDCGSTCWVYGTYEEDTNAIELSDIETRGWELENNNCLHEDFDIIDEASEIIEKLKEME